MIGRLILALALAALLQAPALAQPRRADPDWPCQQPLVPQLTASMMWSGPPLESAGDWRSDPKVTALVGRIAPRDVAQSVGQAEIAAFLRTLGDDRQRAITAAFAGLLDETNRQRGEVIDRIKALAERQRHLAALVSRLSDQLGTIPADATGDAAAERADLVQRWTFTSRAYNELQRTMRYACEVPGGLDARLGAYARALEAGLS